MLGQAEILRVEHSAHRRGGRVHVQAQIVFEQSPARFEQAALKIGIIFFLKNFAQGRHAQRHAHQLLGVAEEIARQFMKLRAIRHHHFVIATEPFAHRGEDVHALQKIARINFTFVR